MKTRLIFTALAAGSSLSLIQAQTSTPPHIVLIMCDDMGFSDLGCYGSEIQTPHIDRLASQGLRFTQFKNTGRSCPSRAALLTGRYQHDAGMGWMTAVDEHRPGYRGQIDAQTPTLAEVLKKSGFRTYMCGKWHLTVDGAFGAPNGSYPVQRGFDRYYGCLSGGGSYYTPTPVYNDLTPVRSFPKDYYYTTAIADSTAAFIARHPADEPMFMYVAFYAPHLPLQAPESRIRKCMDRYKVGYDVLRKQRFEKQKKLGILPQDATLMTYDKEFKDGKKPAWDELTEAQRTQWTRDMATYAAMIEIMDDGVGEIVEAVRKKGMLDNTVFLFLSDNGATNEGGFINQLRADLSNTPYRSYKQWVFQGGTSSPLILTLGKQVAPLHRAGELETAVTHIIDIMPTCMDFAHQLNHREIRKMQLPGASLLPALRRKGIAPHRDLFFEHQGSCAVISDGWKLVRADKESPWELIDLTQDPFETRDLSLAYPDRKHQLESKWNDWAKHHHVLPLQHMPWGKRIQYYKSLNADQDGIDD